MSKTSHAAKLIAYKSTTLDSLTYAAGEVVYDADNNTLRLMNSTTFGGTKMATQPWASSTFTTPAQVTSSINTALTAYTTTSSLTTLLSAKADTSSLATVATSGSYVDLSSKPTINTLAPIQTGNIGKFLTTDSNVVSWATITSSTVGLGNVTNESKATMFTSPAFTGTVTSSGNVGIGNIASANILGNLHISTDSSASVYFDRFGNAPPNMIYRRANGTLASPTAVQTDNQLFALGGRGYGATGFSSGGRAAVYAAAAENWNDTAQGAYLAITTTPNTTATARTVVKVDQDGKVYSYYGLTLGVSGTAGSLVFTGSTSGTVTFLAGATPDVQSYTLPAAYPSVSGYTLVSTTGGVLSWSVPVTGLPTQTNNVGRILTTDGTSASWITPASSRLKLLTGATGTVSHTFSDGPIWRHSSISANFVANFTGVPATEGTVLTITLQLVQGVTPYMPTAVQVEGVSAGSILWFGGVSSGNASKTNVVIFTLVRSASTWTVLGEVKSYG